MPRRRLPATRSLRAPLAATVVALALCLVGSLAHAGASTAVLHREWSVVVPRSVTGPLVVQVGLDFGTEQQCTFFTESSGTDSGLPILFWEEYDGRGSAFFSTYSAQGHVTDIGGTGVTVDTREEIASGGVWSLDSTREGPFEGAWTHRMVIPDAGHWFREATGHHEAYRLHITCDRGFTVGDLAVGTEAIGYSQDSMGGGTGVWLSPTIVGEAGVADGDHVVADMTEPHVVFRLRSATTLVGHTQGEARLTWPDGETTLALDGTGDDLDQEGGPGRWQLDLDRVVVGAYDDFKGVVYGLHPVADLQAALNAL